MTAQRRCLIIFGAIAFLMAQCGAHAHPGTLVSALVKVQPDGAWQMRLNLDLLAYVLGAPPNHGDEEESNALLDGPPAALKSRLTDAKELFRQNFHVKNGGLDAVKELTFPSASDIQQSVKGQRVRLPVMAAVTVSGHLSPGVKTLAFQFDEGLGVVVLTTEFPYQEPISEPVDAGVWSEEQAIPSAASVVQSAAEFQTSAATPAPATPPHPATEPQAPGPANTPIKVASSVKMGPPARPRTPEQPRIPKRTPHMQVAPPTLALVSRPATEALAPPKSPAARPPSVLRPPASLTLRRSPTVLAAFAAPVTERAQTPSLSRRATHFFRYVKMGFTHILPEGLDHILFVVGLFLMSTQLKSLLRQVTAFTVAHSLTLALSLYGVVGLPSSIVEPLIAASIAFVAIENICTTQVKAGRVAVVFGFGLIHGLGFAAALQSLGLRRADLLPALVGFNVGVELGQLTVVMAAFLALGRFRNHPNYRNVVVIPASLATAVTALVWIFQRIS